MCPSCCVNANIWLSSLSTPWLEETHLVHLCARLPSSSFWSGCSPPHLQVEVIPSCNPSACAHALIETSCRLQSIADFHAPCACVRPSPPSPFSEALRFLFPPDRPEDSSASFAVYNNSHVSCSPCSGGNNMRYCTCYIQACPHFEP